MIKVKTGLRGKNAEQKLKMAKHILKNLQTAEKIEIPENLLRDLKLNIRSLKLAIEQAAFGDRRKIAERKAEENLLSTTLKRIALVVDQVAKGNENIIRESGFEVRKSNNKPKTLHPPVELKYKRTNRDGEIWISWKPVPNSRSYVVEYREIGRRKWKSEFTTRSRICFEELTPGKQFEVRVKAIGAKGLSKSSSICRFMAA
jgi:hypothetical protein